MKNSLKGLNIQCDLAEEIVSKLEDRSVQMINYEKQKKKMKKKKEIKQSLKNLWNPIMYTHIHTMEVLGRKGKKVKKVYLKNKGQIIY